MTRRARALPVLIAGLSLALGCPAAGLAQTVPAAAVLSPNDTQFRPGETIAFGLAVAVPPGNPAADLYVGAVLPDGLTALFFTAPGVLSPPISVLAPASFPRFAPAPPGFTLQTPVFFQLTFPVAGVPPGTYKIFAALVRQGSLADGRIDAADVLSLDLRPISFGTAIQLFPGSGPSGTFVNVTGTGFTGGSPITFGAAPVPGVFVSVTQLAFLVPFDQQGGAAVALTPGARSVQVSGGPAQPFSVTSPPVNASAPGTVAQGAVNSTGQTIASNRAAIDGALLGLKAQAQTAAASTYLDTMSSMVADIQALFTEDLTTIGTGLDAATLAALEQSLLNPASPPTLLPVTVSATPLLAGDDFLDRRQVVVSAGAQAARAGQVLSLICPLSTSSLCGIAGAAFTLTSTIADLIVGSSGNLVGLRLGATTGVTDSTPSRLTLRLKAVDRPTLQSFIIVQRQLNALDPVRIAFEIEAAQALIARALASPGLGAATVARLQRLAQALVVLDALGASLAADIPLGATQELPVSFSRVTVGCPADLFASLSIDSLGVVSLIRQAGFDLTRVCDFHLGSQFLTRGESGSRFEVGFTVATYGSVTFAPVRPAVAWASLLLVVGLVVGQVARRRASPATRPVR
jgi:hypothetical protein